MHRGSEREAAEWVYEWIHEWVKQWRDKFNFFHIILFRIKILPSSHTSTHTLSLLYGENSHYALLRVNCCARNTTPSPPNQKMYTQKKNVIWFSKRKKPKPNHPTRTRACRDWSDVHVQLKHEIFFFFVLVGIINISCYCRMDHFFEILRNSRAS